MTDSEREVRMRAASIKANTKAEHDRIFGSVSPMSKPAQIPAELIPELVEWLMDEPILEEIVDDYRDVVEEELTAALEAFNAREVKE